MRRFIISFFFFCFSFNSFALTFDILAGLSYKNTAITGKTVLDNVSMDYDASFNSVGLNLGLDLLFNSCIGIYTRLGLYDVQDSARSVAGNSKDLKSASGNYSMTYDLGLALNFALAKHFFICVSPSVSLNYIDYKNYEFNLWGENYAVIDNALCYGFSADVYLKFRYKHFVCALGCSGSILPFCLVTSEDTAIDYSFSINDATGYNIRPYIAAGVSL